MGNITNLFQFGWYEWTYFWEEKNKFTFQTEVLVRRVGTTGNYCNKMCQAILQINREVIPRWSIIRLCPNELAPSNKYEYQKRSAFDAAIR